MILIGLAGLPGSGRDRIAKHLVTAHNFAQYRMSGPIRNMLAGGLGIDLDLFDDPAKRHQQFGLRMPTPAVLESSLRSWGENINPDLWMAIAASALNERAAAETERMKNPGEQLCPGVVISDLHNDNEANWIRRHGGYIWHTADVSMPVGQDVVRYVDDDPSLLVGPHDDVGPLVDSVLRALYAQGIAISPRSTQSVNAEAA